MIRTIFFIAWRRLLARRRQSLSVVLGLAVGVMVLISAVSMMDGLKVAFIRQMLQVSPHLKVQPEPAVPKRRLLIAGDHDLVALALPEAPDEETQIKGYRALMAWLDRLPGARIASPALFTDGFAINGALEAPARIHGVDPTRQESIGNLPDRVVAGSYQDFKASPDGAALGDRLARELGLEVGDRVRAVGSAGTYQSFRVSALLKTGMTAFDQSHLLIHLERAQTLEGAAPDRVTAFEVGALEPENVDALAAQIQRGLGQKVETWREENANTLALYSMIGRISYFLVVFTMLAAGLGVSNLLTTVVLQKRKDIAVMLSMGYTRPMVSRTFLLEGGILGLCGVGLGCVLGFANTQLLGLIPVDFGEASVMAQDRLYMNQSPWYYAASAAFGFVVCLIASSFPARRAARLDPIEIIRREM